MSLEWLVYGLNNVTAFEAKFKFMITYFKQNKCHMGKGGGEGGLANCS